MNLLGALRGSAPTLSLSRAPSWKIEQKERAPRHTAPSSLRGVGGVGRELQAVSKSERLSVLGATRVRDEKEGIFFIARLRCTSRGNLFLNVFFW